MILKGYVTEIKEGGKYAKVQTIEDEVLNDVLMIYPYGFNSFMQNDSTSLVLLFCVNGSKSNVVGIPYNPQLQAAIEENEVETGNFNVGNKILYNKDGNIEITGTNDFLANTLKNLTVTAETKITLSAPDVSLGDAVGLILNDSATMQVTIPSGSSAGTYNVNIVSAGQTKAKA